MPSKLKLNNRLPDIGSLIRFGASICEKEGGILSKIYDIVWPKNKPHLWSTLREEIEDLTGKKASEWDWESHEGIYEFLQHAFEKINQSIIENNYELAGNLLISLILSNENIEDLFKGINIDHDLEYVPLLVVIVNLKIAIFIETIKYAELFKVSASYIDIFKTALQVEIKGSQEYIAQCYKDILQQYGKDNKTYFKFSYYYGVTVGVFTSLWLTNFDDYLSNSLSGHYYVPAIVAGTFYKLVNINGKLNTVLMTPHEIAQNSMMPSTNLLGALYQEPKVFPKGYINNIFIYINLNDKYKTTGLDLIYTNPHEKYEMGMTTNNNKNHMWLITFKMIVNTNRGEFINKVSISSDSFVTGFIFSTNENNTLKTDPYFNSAKAQETSIINPFTINAMYVPSDKAGELRSTNHQMAGIAMSVIFNEYLAKKYVRELYK